MSPELCFGSAAAQAQQGLREPGALGTCPVPVLGTAHGHWVSALSWHGLRAAGAWLVPYESRVLTSSYSGI